MPHACPPQSINCLSVHTENVIWQWDDDDACDDNDNGDDDDACDGDDDDGNGNDK